MQANFTAPSVALSALLVLFLGVLVIQMLCCLIYALTWLVS